MFSNIRDIAYNRNSGTPCILNTQICSIVLCSGEFLSIFIWSWQKTPTLLKTLISRYQSLIIYRFGNYAKNMQNCGLAYISRCHLRILSSRAYLVTLLPQFNSIRIISVFQIGKLRKQVIIIMANTSRPRTRQTVLGQLCDDSHFAVMPAAVNADYGSRISNGGVSAGYNGSTVPLRYGFMIEQTWRFPGVIINLNRSENVVCKLVCF